MNAVAYSVKSFEKEFLQKANHIKHDISMVEKSLDIDSVIYARGKDTVIVFTNDNVSAPVIEKLAELGVKYIATRSVGTDHIDKEAAHRFGISISNVPSYSPQAIAEHTLSLAFALNRKIILANTQVHSFDFRNEDLIGFNFSGKTVGIIGLGHTGRATANIFLGMGSRVIGFDLYLPENFSHIQMVGLETLLKLSDIISLHLPLNAGTRHFLDKTKFDLMKKGVMLINTSRGPIIDTRDLIGALDQGIIGYLGLDVYEFEKGLFFEDHEHDRKKDPLLEKLLSYPNVLITPHQAYLTKEALDEIAQQTIRNLDIWQEEKDRKLALSIH